MPRKQKHFCNPRPKSKGSPKSYLLMFWKNCKSSYRMKFCSSKFVLLTMLLTRLNMQQQKRPNMLLNVLQKTAKKTVDLGEKKPFYCLSKLYLLCGNKCWKVWKLSWVFLWSISVPKLLRKSISRSKRLLLCACNWVFLIYFSIGYQ